MVLNLESFNTIIGLAVTFNFAATIISSPGTKTTFINLCVKYILCFDSYISSTTSNLKNRVKYIRIGFDNCQTNGDPNKYDPFKNSCDNCLDSIKEVESLAKKNFKNKFKAHHFGPLCMYFGLIGMTQLFAISFIKLWPVLSTHLLFYSNLLSICYVCGLFLCIILYYNNHNWINTLVTNKRDRIDNYTLSGRAFACILMFSLLFSSINVLYPKWGICEFFFKLIIYLTPIISISSFIIHFIIFSFKARRYQDKIIEKDRLSSIQSLCDSMEGALNFYSNNYSLKIGTGSGKPQASGQNNNTRTSTHTKKTKPTKKK